MLKLILPNQVSITFREMYKIQKNKWLMFDIFNRLWDKDLDNVHKLGLVPDIYYHQRLRMLQVAAFDECAQDFYLLVVRSINYEGFHENLKADCGHHGQHANLRFMPTKNGFGYVCNWCESRRCTKCGDQFDTEIHHHHKCKFICGKCGTMPCEDNTYECVCGKTHCANAESGYCVQCIKCKKYQCIYSDMLVCFINGACISCQ